MSEKSQAEESEAEEEVDLSFLDDEVVEIESSQTEEPEEELDLSFLGEDIQGSPEDVLQEESEEIDLDFLEESPTDTGATVSAEEAIDLSSLGEESKEEIAVHKEESSTLTLQNEASSQEVPARNEVIQSFLAANVQKSDVFSIQEDSFFAEESPKETDFQSQDDEDVAIPTASSAGDEEEIDLDFFEDLFDD